MDLIISQNLSNLEQFIRKRHIKSTKIDKNTKKWPKIDNKYQKI